MNNVSSNYAKQEAASQFLQNVAARNKGAAMNQSKSMETSQQDEKKQGLNENLNGKEASLYISQESQMLLEQMKRMREENEDSADMAEKQSKCMLIAMRIAAGDEVPQKDIKFLMKYNMGLYAKAMEMRVPKPDPEEYDTVLSEDDVKDIEKTDMGMMPDMSDPLGLFDSEA